MFTRNRNWYGVVLATVVGAMTTVPSSHVWAGVGAEGMGKPRPAVRRPPKADLLEPDFNLDEQKPKGGGDGDPSKAKVREPALLRSGLRTRLGSAGRASAGNSRMTRRIRRTSRTGLLRRRISSGNRSLRSVGTRNRTGGVASFTLRSGLASGPKAQTLKQTGAPDLVIVSVTPDLPGRRPERITIRNAGRETAKSYDVLVKTFHLDFKPRYETLIRKPLSLAPGQRVTFSLNAPSDGLRWSIHLDPNQKVAESNERNNSWFGQRAR